MIEIVYKEEQKKANGNEAFFKIPNNVRQMGEIKGQQKIYLEDYAYTFLKKLAKGAGEHGQAAVLLGAYHWSEGIAYLFIRSALQIPDMEVSTEHIAFTEKIWAGIYEETEKYFPEQEIVGWFVSFPGLTSGVNDMVLKTHLNHFAGNDKVLFASESGEWEESFFVYENNQLVRQSGYYIFYEKNEPMQAYMIEKNQNRSIEETEKVPDRAVVDFRKAVKEKQEKKEEPEMSDKTMRWVTRACYTAAAFAIGFAVYQRSGWIQGSLREAGQVEHQLEEDAASVSPKDETMEEKKAEERAEQLPEKTPDNTPEGVGEVRENASEEAGETPENASGEPQEDSMEGTGEIPEETPEVTEGTKQETTEDLKMPEKEKHVETTAASGEEYLIRRGDTLTSICQEKYGSIRRLDEVCKVNHISPEDVIYAGQKIILPD